jgi:hypothetical protein
MRVVAAAICPIMMSGAGLAIERQIVMLGEPVAGVAEAIGESGEVERVAQRLRPEEPSATRR